MMLLIFAGFLLSLQSSAHITKDSLFHVTTVQYSDFLQHGKGCDLYVINVIFLLPVFLLSASSLRLPRSAAAACLQEVCTDRVVVVGNIYLYEYLDCLSFSLHPWHPEEIVMASSQSSLWLLSSFRGTSENMETAMVYSHRQLPLLLWIHYSKCLSTLLFVSNTLSFWVALW